MAGTPEDARTEVRPADAPARSEPRFTAGQLVAGRYRIVAPSAVSRTLKKELGGRDRRGDHLGAREFY